MRDVSGGDPALPDRVTGGALRCGSRVEARPLLSGSRLEVDGKESIDPAILFQDAATAAGLILAVSGGPDSTALMHLAQAWKPAHRPPIWVATVDHGLSPGSRETAGQVVDDARRLGFPSVLLVWTGAKPARAVQEAARAARYTLLEAFAADVGASHLMTAHTLDDQAETVLFRMARGSGIAGLAGMRRIVARGSLLHIRPFLALRKSALVDLCERSGWRYVTDPANGNPRFARARLRDLAAALAAEGLTAERLDCLASRMARADEALRMMADDAAARTSVVSPVLGRSIDFAALATSPLEVVVRVVADAVASLNTDARYRLERIERFTIACLAAFRQGAPLSRTLHGCRLILDARGALRITREDPRRRGRPVAGDAGQSP